MKKIREQDKLFKFLNKNKVKYAVLRGYDENSENKKKDLDILILKKDYEKFKNKMPEINRQVDFYPNQEIHKGVIFVPKQALFRVEFDNEKGFFVLSKKDQKKMESMRKLIKASLVVRKPARKIKNKIKVMHRTKRLFGIRYVLWDIPYQLSRLLQKVLVKNYKLNEKQELVKKKVNDYEMWINKNGKGIHRDLYYKGVREKISNKIVKELLKKEDVILEAGANIGYYVILEAKEIGNRGIVYAVEPIKENFELLKKNIQLNKLKNVKAFNIGFSDNPGKININVSSEGNLNTPYDIGKTDRVESVKCDTLDNFFKNKKKPDFMRMDIEGYEDVVFKGGEKTLDNLRVIFVELHFPLLGKERSIALLKKLKEKDFEIHKAVMEWERFEDPRKKINRIVNYFHDKRSKPKTYNSKELTIDKLIKSKEFIKGHLSLEVFFVKNNKNNK